MLMTTSLEETDAPRERCYDIVFPDALRRYCAMLTPPCAYDMPPPAFTISPLDMAVIFALPRASRRALRQARAASAQADSAACQYAARRLLFRVATPARMLDAQRVAAAPIFTPLRQR